METDENETRRTLRVILPRLLPGLALPQFGPSLSHWPTPEPGQRARMGQEDSSVQPSSWWPSQIGRKAKRACISSESTKHHAEWLAGPHSQS